MLRAVTAGDIPVINGWLAKHEAPPLLPECFSTTGLVSDGVAAGFLYKTNSAVGLLESFVSNPEASPLDVSRDLEAITDALIETAKQAKVIGLVVMSRQASVVRRLKARGFAEQPGPWSVLLRRV